MAVVLVGCVVVVMVVLRDGSIGSASISAGR